MSNVRDWARWYLSRGWVPISFASASKEAKGFGWQRDTVEVAKAELDARFPEGVEVNVGIVLGDASGGLTDIDLDCVETISLAGLFLPETAMFGRASKERSHWIYVSPGSVTHRFDDPCGTSGKKNTLVEIRGKNKRKPGGAMTVFPPSIHKSGEPISFVDANAAIATVEADVLARQVALLAASALLARHWVFEGSRHHATLALAGALLSRGCPLDDVLLVVRGIVEVTGDDELDDRLAAVQSTAETLVEGGEATGAPTLEALGLPEDVVKAVLRWICPTTKTDASAPGLVREDGVHPLTDLANGRRLAQRFGAELRYCAEQDKWYAWTGQHWRVDRIWPRQFAEQTTKAIFEEARAALALGNADLAKMLRVWGKTSQSVMGITNMLRAAQTADGIAVPANVFDRDPWLIACPNGTLDLRTGELRPASQADLLTRLCPTPYDPAADCPRWRQFVHELMGGDEDLVTFLQLAMGYTLTGCVRKQILFLLYGLGANGKSTFLRTVQTVLGGDLACTVPSDLLLTPPGGGSQHPTGLTTMYGKRLAVTFEPEMNRTLAEGLVKGITGGDKISARRMHEDFWEYDPRHTIWISTNHKPIVRGTDEGIWRRIVPIPFIVTFTQPDEELSEKLLEEAPGIFNWLVEGARVFFELPSAFVLPTAADAFKKQYRAEQDVIGNFLADCTERAEGVRTEYGWIWRTYLSYCAQESSEPVSQRAFAAMLDERGFPGNRTKHERFREHLKLVGPLAAAAKTTFRPTVISGGRA